MTTITGMLTSLTNSNYTNQLVSYADKTSTTNYNISLYSANNDSFDLIENGINSSYYYSTALFDGNLNKYIFYTEGVNIYSINGGSPAITTIEFIIFPDPSLQIVFTACIYATFETYAKCLLGGTKDNVPFIFNTNIPHPGGTDVIYVRTDEIFDTFWASSNLNPNNLPLSQYNITLANNTNNPSVYVNLTFNDGVVDPVSYVIYGEDLNRPTESWTLLSL
jgi:hypothetical protein